MVVVGGGVLHDNDDAGNDNDDDFVALGLISFFKSYLYGCDVALRCILG